MLHYTIRYLLLWYCFLVVYLFGIKYQVFCCSSCLLSLLFSIPGGLCWGLLVSGNFHPLGAGRWPIMHCICTAMFIMKGQMLFLFNSIRWIVLYGRILIVLIGQKACWIIMLKGLVFIL